MRLTSFVLGFVLVLFSFLGLTAKADCVQHNAFFYPQPIDTVAHQQIITALSDGSGYKIVNGTHVSFNLGCIPSFQANTCPIVDGQAWIRQPGIGPEGAPLFGYSGTPWLENFFDFYPGPTYSASYAVSTYDPGFGAWVFYIYIDIGPTETFPLQIPVTYGNEGVQAGFMLQQKVIVIPTDGDYTNNGVTNVDDLVLVVTHYGIYNIDDLVNVVTHWD